MAPLIYPLASGSLGNALLVASGRTRLLVDFGIGRRRAVAAMQAAGIEPETIDALLVTHTHGDHFSQAAVGWCLAYSIRVFSTATNLAHLASAMPGFRRLGRAGLLETLDPGAPGVAIGDAAVEGFLVPHDSPGDCLGFRITLGGRRGRRVVTVATDLGHVPDECFDRFADADAVVLESNHDPVMLARSGRPMDLIKRIAGPNGHLSNQDCGRAVGEIVKRSRRRRVRHVVLAHLSRDCNRPALALEAQAHLAQKSKPVHLAAASQFEPGPMLEL